MTRSDQTPTPALAAADRLAQLAATGLLDSPAEAAFDRVARLATRLLGAPVALVSLVDAERQFFKSCIGLPEPFASTRGTPLSHSICQHVVAANEGGGQTPLVLRDTHADPAFRDHPATRDLGVAAYLGVPLVTDAGHALGTLCVIDRAPHEWSDDDVTVLVDVAAAATAEIELRLCVGSSERLRREAQSANAAKAQFLTMMSHELRTPLNAIAGHAQLIELGVHGPVTEAQSEALGRIQASQKHLLGLINSVLNYAKLESGRVRYDVRPVRLGEAVRAVHALVAAPARDKGVSVTVGRAGDDLVVLADADKLRQIVLNLLTNAVKFTAPGGAVRVECGGAAAAGQAAVRVHDTGRGIAAGQLDSVFDPFIQLGRRHTSADEGTGLGLAISRDLARGMGGDLTAESEVGRGSAFTLTLPAA